MVNNTGHPPKGDLLGLEDASRQAGVEMLLLNVIRIMRRVTPVMRRQGGGAVVNISSYAAAMPECSGCRLRPCAVPRSARSRGFMPNVMRLTDSA